MGKENSFFQGSKELVKDLIGTAFPKANDSIIFYEKFCKELDSLATGRNKKTGLTKKEEKYLLNLQKTVA